MWRVVKLFETKNGMFRYRLVRKVSSLSMAEFIARSLSVLLSNSECLICVQKV